MGAAQMKMFNPRTLSQSKRESLERTQRFLRHTVRKVLSSSCDSEIFEMALFVEDPHIYATWATQSCLLGAGLKIGFRVQFDTPDAQRLLEMQGKVAHSPVSEQVVQHMQESTDLILEHLQRYCQSAGLITGISQATVCKAFSKGQSPIYQLRGGAIDAWLLRINECDLYCTTHVIFDESEDLVLLGQSLPS